MKNLVFDMKRPGPRPFVQVPFQNKLSIACCLLTLSFLPAAAADNGQGILQAGDRVAICGDSITEMGGYSASIEDYLLMCQPGPKPYVFTAGQSGEAAPSFVTRMDCDVLPFKPTVVLFCYGMNDGQYRAADPKVVENYKNAEGQIVDKLKQNGIRQIIVGSPGVVDSENFKTNGVSKMGADGPTIYNQTLGGLAAAGKQVAADHGVAFADIHDAMMRVMEQVKAKYGANYEFAGRPGDGVHPGPTGSLCMVYAYLKAMGFDGNIGTITFDMPSNQATATDGHKILSAQNGTIQMESSRYPFCFNGNGRGQGLPESSPEVKAIQPVLEFLPFNQDLNRFMLVVKNATPKKLKVTFGKQSKEFAAADLEKGVNLAAEFLDNPFGPKFSAVHGMVYQQQFFNTNCRVLNHANPAWITALPASEPDIKHLEAALYKRYDDLSSAAAAAATPVTYTIQIAPSE